MVTNKKVFGKAMSLPAGIAIGGGAALVVTLFLAAGLTQLVLSERIDEGSIGYWASGALPACSALGALIAVGVIKRKRMQVCLLTGALYFITLLAINVLFFGGQFSGVGVTVLLILLGTGAVGLLGARGERRGGKRHKPYRSR